MVCVLKKCFEKHWITINNKNRKRNYKKKPLAKSQWLEYFIEKKEITFFFL